MTIKKTILLPFLSNRNLNTCPFARKREENTGIWLWQSKELLKLDGEKVHAMCLKERCS